MVRLKGMDARNPLHSEVYTDEERAFIAAVEAWMKDKKCKFPRFTDVLAVAKALGYRKLTPGEAKVLDALKTTQMEDES